METIDRETIIKLARDAGAMFDHMTWVERDLAPVFERFAKLVAEHEREACAALADTEADEWGSNSDGCYASRNISTAIRARGNHD